MLAVLLGPIISQGWWQGFRRYFANDQLSYAAIAITAANGTFTPVEPLTETGVSHYPSGWYLLIGAVSGLSDTPVYRIWSLLGLLTIAAGLAFLGWLAYRYSLLALAPLLPGLALLTGTLSVATEQNWYSALTKHAVIWGPFGTLFTLNAEAIGLIILTGLIGMLLLASTNAAHPLALIIIAAVALGALANIQTYAFLTGTSLVVLFAATISLLRMPSRTRLLTSLGLLGALLIAGPTLADVVGPLPLFALVLLAALPATWPLLVRQPRVTALVLAGYALAASPQIIRTGLGIITSDDFLAYRQVSTEDLGVQPSAALIAALPLLLIALFSVITLIAAKPSTERDVFRALLIALGLGAAIMASNDLWGFNQEPYRFWLQYSIITAFLLSITTAWALRQHRMLGSAWRSATAVVAVLAVGLWGFSLRDVQEFAAFASEQGVEPADDERGRALQALIAPKTGLVLSSRCLDPQVLKLITNAPVAFFNRGLAWPDYRTEIDELLKQDQSTPVDAQLIDTIGITHVLTDSACTNDWKFADARIQPIDVQPYQSGLFTLWQVQGP